MGFTRSGLLGLLVYIGLAVEDSAQPFVKEESEGNRLMGREGDDLGRFVVLGCGDAVILFAVLLNANLDVTFVAAIDEIGNDFAVFEDGKHIGDVPNGETHGGSGMIPIILGCIVGKKWGILMGQLPIQGGDSDFAHLVIDLECSTPSFGNGSVEIARRFVDLEHGCADEILVGGAIVVVICSTPNGNGAAGAGGSAVAR